MRFLANRVQACFLQKTVTIMTHLSLPRHMATLILLTVHVYGTVCYALYFHLWGEKHC